MSYFGGRGNEQGCIPSDYDSLRVDPRGYPPDRTFSPRISRRRPDCHPIMSETSSVPPVNSDQFDKLGFVAHQSFAFRTCSNGLFRLPQRLVSEPCGPPVGDPGLTSSARSAAALCQAPEVEPC